MTPTPRIPRRTSLVPLFLAASLGCVAAPAGGPGPSGDGPGSAGPGKGDGDGTPAAWTVLVYGSFDTHDAGGIPSSLLEMSHKVTVDQPRVNLLYLEDPPEGPNTRLFLVGARHVEVVHDFGELHLGSPETLTEVLRQVAERFPAERYFLDLVGHTSSAVAAFLPDYFPDRGSWDRQRMMYWQVRQAILDAGVPLDVLALSGCGTGDLEIVAAFSDTARYVVGLQEYNLGYTDVRWADSLARNPDLDARGLARRVGEGLFKKAYYDQGSTGSTGAYDTARMPEVEDALTALSAALLDRMASDGAALAAARRSALQMTSPGFEFLVDAKDLADEIAANSVDPETRARAEELGSALDALLVGGGAPSYADPETHSRAHGVSLVFMARATGGRIQDPDDFDEASAWPPGEAGFYERTGWRDVVTAVYPRLR